jgi:hypothetical protein
LTNTLHRQGSPEELKGDYVVFVTMARGVNKEGSAPKIHEFLRICARHNPVSMGSSKIGNVLMNDVSFEDLVTKLKDGSTATAVFTDVDTPRSWRT